MRKRSLIRILLFVSGLLNNLKTYGQCDSIANICTKNLSSAFISDGQSYRALLVKQETAEFKAVFYGNSTYRIAACSGFSDGNLIFSVFDQDHNLLFTNSEFQNSPFWDLSFKSTMSCTIEAQLNNANLVSGCAVLIIGFK